MTGATFFSSTVREVLSRFNKQGSPFLVAVSGGSDSMALLHCCISLRLPCVAAHVNYALRGRESDADEALVRNFCEKHQVPMEVLKVVDSDWSDHPGSTQEAARNIRYAWFKSLREKYTASYVLTAHHANDQTETMLFQFVRGGAGKSIYGMREHADGVLRPMLSIPKKSVMEYLNENAIPWRQDASNESTDYRRNRVRHEILPVIESLNPSIHETIQLRSDWMHQEQAMVDWAAKILLEKIVTHTPDSEAVSVTDLIATGFHRALLWKWLGRNGFTSQQVIQIGEHLCKGSSSESTWFYSPLRRVCIQNDRIVCLALPQVISENILSIPWSGRGVHIDYCHPSEVEYSGDQNCQYLDAGRVSLPLVLRNWKDGDRFHPLGLSGNKKVSDFLTQAKIPAWQKQGVLVLCSGDEVLAVLQQRISENFKKTDSTLRCLRIQFS